MQSLNHSHYITEDDNGFTLTKSLLLDDIVLQVDEVHCFVTEVMSTQAVQHQTDPLLHPACSTGLHILHNLTGAILRTKEKSYQ